MNPIDSNEYNKRRDQKSKKVTVYMNPGQKWLLKEIAHGRDQSQKQALFDAIEYYWCNAIPHTKKNG